MRKHHPENERIKREYLSYLEEAKRLKPASVDQVAAAIADFETSTRYKDFRKFRKEQAVSYKARLSKQIYPKTGKPLSKSTIHSRLMTLKAFFLWLAGQHGYRRKLTYSDADYFNPSATDSRIARAVRKGPPPTVDQILTVLRAMPATTEIEMRDRAVFAFTFLTGARDLAIASMKIKHVDLARRSVFQDAREVRTKNSKTFTSWFFPVGGEVEAIVADWIGYLTTEKHFGQDDPLFPATKVAIGENGLFASIGLDRTHWKNADPIRRIFRNGFALAGLDYFNPHRIRDTLTLLGERVCATPEEFKAWSQNLGHEGVLTTFTSYGQVQPERQAELLAAVRHRPANEAVRKGPPDAATIKRVLDHLSETTG
jgi:integrase/recombinase XerC